MRLLPVLLVGASALILSACDDHQPRKAPAPKAQSVASGERADCCCKDICPTAKPPVVGTLEEEGVVARRDGRHVRRVSHERRGGYRHRVRTGTEGVGYLDEESYAYRRVRSGTEGVGYLDEDGAYRGGGYRRVGGSISVEERETYSESARYSESESGYRYSTGGGYVAYEGRDGYGDHRRRRRGGGGYAGVDRDGYLTWPGKTE
jgi:hypothetical protein